MDFAEGDLREINLVRVLPKPLAHFPFKKHCVYGSLGGSVD